MAGKVLGINKSQKATTVKITKIIQDKRFLKTLGDDIVKKIQGTTRRGKSLVTGDAIPDLSPGYIVFRRVYAALRRARTHKLFKAQRSNLTFFGKLIDAIQAKVKAGRFTEARIVIDIAKGRGKKPDRLEAQEIAKALKRLKIPKNLHKFAYIWNALIARQGAKTLKDISDDVQKRRPFLGIDKKTEDTITTQVRRQLRKQLKT